MTRLALRCGQPGDPDILASWTAMQIEARASSVQPLLAPGLAMSGPVQVRTPAGVLIAGDLDLTDLDDLRRALDMPDATQSDLLGGALARWGDDLGDHLEGAFALAIWHPGQARLLVLRDRFGIKPLTFHAAPGALHVASDPALIAAALPIRPAPDEGWIADFLAGNVPDARATAWRGIERLPAGHMLSFRDGRAEVRRWWTLAPRTLSRAETTPEALRDALDHATAQTLSGGSTAAMLSGGLDSSTLALLAAARSDRPLPVYSLRFSQLKSLDEGHYIDAVLAAGRFQPHRIEGGTGSAFDPAEADAIIRAQNQPFPGFGLLTTNMIYRSAQADGHTAMIDGHGGDEVISSASWHFADLARQGEWMALWHLLRQMFGFVGTGSAVLPFLSMVAKHGSQPWSGIAMRIGWRLTKGQRGPVAADPASIIATDLAGRIDLAGRAGAVARAAAHEGPPGFAAHAAIAVGPTLPGTFEVLDRVAHANGMTPRYPFYDRRVVDLCLNRASADKIANGQPRALLRNAMKGVLPEAVRLRTDKIDFTANIRRSVVADPAGRLSSLCDAPSDRLATYANADRLRALGHWLRGPEGNGFPVDMQHLWRVAWLDLWLKREDAATDRAVQLATYRPEVLP